MRADYNPREIIEIPIIGVPTIRIGLLRMINVFGEQTHGYDIVEDDEPNLLWENGSAMSWEDGNNILLEQQLVRVWQRAKR